MNLIPRICFCLIVILAATPAYSAVFFVDGNLSSGCSGNYSVANRSCTGSDGNAYKTVAAGVTALRAGDTMYIRGAGGSFDGYYHEDHKSGMPGFGSFSSMTTVSGYQEEWPIMHPDSGGKLSG